MPSSALRPFLRRTAAAALLAALAALPARAGAHDYKTYWDRALPFAKVATIPGAIRLFEGPLPAWGTAPKPGHEDVMSDIDVLTAAGDVVRLTKDPDRIAYAESVFYGKSDAIDYVRAGKGACLLTRDGTVLAENAQGFRPLGRFEGARALGFGGGSLYVLGGDGRILRVPGPGQAEVFYQSSAPITAMAASPLGVFFLGVGGVYFVAHPGAAIQVLEGDPDEFGKIVYGDNNNGGGNSIGGRFAEAGLASPPYPKGWLYLVRKSGTVSYLDWSGGVNRLFDDKVTRFHGYQASDFNYYTYFDAAGALIRKDFGSPGLDRIRDPDPDVIDYTSFDLVHVVLRKDGEVVVASEQNEGNRAAAGSAALPIGDIMKDLRIQPWTFAGYTMQRETRAEAWRLLREDLAKDERPEVQAARTGLPRLMATYDPETVKGGEQHFEKYLEVRDQLRQCLEPLRAKRGDPSLDLEEDLADADHLLDRDLVPGPVHAKTDALVDAIVAASLARVEGLPGPGPKTLGRMLRNFALKRRVGLLEWRLGAAVQRIRDDRRAGLWSPRT